MLTEKLAQDVASVVTSKLNKNTVADKLAYDIALSTAPKLHYIKTAGFPATMAKDLTHGSGHTIANILKGLGIGAGAGLGAVGIGTALGTGYGINKANRQEAEMSALADTMQKEIGNKAVERELNLAHSHPGIDSLVPNNFTAQDYGDMFGKSLSARNSQNTRTNNIIDDIRANQHLVHHTPADAIGPTPDLQFTAQDYEDLFRKNLSAQASPDIQFTAQDYEDLFGKDPSAQALPNSMPADTISTTPGTQFTAQDYGDLFGKNLSASHNARALEAAKDRAILERLTNTYMNTARGGGTISAAKPTILSRVRDAFAPVSTAMGSASEKALRKIQRFNELPEEIEARAARAKDRVIRGSKAVSDKVNQGLQNFADTANRKGREFAEGIADKTQQGIDAAGRTANRVYEDTADALRQLRGQGAYSTTSSNRTALEVYKATKVKELAQKLMENGMDPRSAFRSAVLRVDASLK